MATDNSDGNGGGSGEGGGGARCITEYKDVGSIDDSYRYYLSRRTVLEMLRDRGYAVSDSEITRSFSEFRVAFGNQPGLDRLRISVSLRSNPYKKILVIFMGTDEIRTAHIRAMYGQILSKESFGRLMLILQSKMNSFARKELDKFSFKVEIFQIADLYINITKHVLVPKFELLTAEEKAILLKKYKLEDNQLPWMLETDAIARYYGLVKGQVVKITYSGGIVDSLGTYRCVF